MVEFKVKILNATDPTKYVDCSLPSLCPRARFVAGYGSKDNALDTDAWGAWLDGLESWTAGGWNHFSFHWTIPDEWVSSRPKNRNKNCCPVVG